MNLGAERLLELWIFRKNVREPQDGLPGKAEPFSSLGISTPSEGKP